ncbi:MAG TPA: translation initiation factor IF-2 [Candidatus Saccharibacteria bacterium]|nr:translation initiation factor IF-2 [Candidatus Saccharibacteria bacterium]
MDQSRNIAIGETITVGQLAAAINLPPSKLIGELFKNGIVTNINQRIDIDTAQIIIDDLDLEIKLTKSNDSVPEEDTPEQDSIGNDVASMSDPKSRPPIVAIMGHVDHGKTSLLDSILNLEKASKEAGGITQHISAYQASYQNRKITFLDTPGHEAFSALRQHGAHLTDICIIVVAADDGVKPQTIEAINFAKNAGSNIIVAINKIDKQSSNTNLIKQQLSENGLLIEEWGGDTVVAEVSAKTKLGIDKLLDMILLVADVNEVIVDYGKPAEGIIIESKIEKGLGGTASLLVTEGILNKGDYITTSEGYGVTRTMTGWDGKPLKIAEPSTPVNVSGFKSAPSFGLKFKAYTKEKDAKKASQDSVKSNAIESLDMGSQELLRMISKDRSQSEAKYVLKADVKGSLKSVIDSVALLENDEVVARFVSYGIGDLTESDVQAASAAGAKIILFNAKSSRDLARLASNKNVDIVSYSVIYELIDMIKADMENALEPEVVREDIGKLKVQGVFRITKEVIITGGDVTKGKIVPGAKVIIKKGKEVIGEAVVETLQKGQEKVEQALEGDACGMSLKTESKLNLEVGNSLEFYTEELVKRKLKFN